MTGQHPRLRSHVRTRKSGERVVYYVYDMRHEGKPDIPLGKDYAHALVKWREIHEHKPQIAGTLLEAFERWSEDVLPTYENAGTRRTYATNMRRLAPVFGPSTWDRVTLPILKGYLKARSAKTQANREMALLSVVWNWARGEGLHELPWPAAGMERARWKNKEQARQFEVTEDVFSALHAAADPALASCLDLASATGMRLTDCLNVQMPTGDVLRFRANKTGKAAEFSVAASPTLTALVETRKAIKASHLMLLSTPDGRKVSPTMLRDRYDAARAKAAEKAEAAGDADLAQRIRSMYLRDCRKYAADLAEDTDEASKLLQHSSKRLTEIHYRTKAVKLKPVR